MTKEDMLVGQKNRPRNKMNQLMYSDEISMFMPRIIYGFPSSNFHLDKRANSISASNHQIRNIFSSSAVLMFNNVSNAER